MFRKEAMKRILFVSFLLLGLSASGGWATKYAGEFMALGVGARALGMGGAFVSLADDATAAYWNPAGIIQATSREASFMHSETFGSLVKYDYAAGILPAVKLRGRQGTVGLAVMRLGVGKIPYSNDALIDLNGNGIMDPGERLDLSKVRMISDAEWAGYLTYARKRGGRMLWGVNAKGIYKTVGSNSAYGLGLDLGLIYRPMPILALGANLQDATTTFVAWNTGTTDIVTPCLKMGSSISPEVPFAKGKLTLAMDGDVRYENRRTASQYSMGRASLDMHYGAEFWYKEVVAARIGSDVGRFSFGAGVKGTEQRFNFLKSLHLREVRLDYAFLGDDDLGNSTRISGSAGF